MPQAQSELERTVAVTGPERAGRRSNLRALAALVVPTPTVESDRLVLSVSAPWSCEPLRLRIEVVAPEDATHHDAVIFVADSHAARSDDNRAAMQKLDDALASHGRSLRTVPHVIQYNKRDLRVVCCASELRSQLNRYGADEIEAAAGQGRGVLTTLVLVTHAMSPRRSYPTL